MMWTTIKVGEAFLDYYRSLGYEIIPGSSLLDESVPMSFVMSAGMVQFEKLAGRKRSSDRYALIQNCFRYFDLDKVGISDYHLSLFQMPATFDFGQLDRKQTIMQIWYLLTQVYHFNPGHLAVTCFGGGRILETKLLADLEALEAWRAAGLPESQIHALPAPENFWKQNALHVGAVNSRKCGPTTEVFYDRGQHFACGPACRPGCSCGRFVELLNTLFIFLRVNENGDLLPLEEPFTETVIGRERVTAILQGLPSVYEIDVLLPLILQTRRAAHAAILTEDERRKHERLLVDHLRALLFLTADGAPPPGRGGRARLMRILARELLTSQRLLGISDAGFLRGLVRLALEIYPHLAPAQERTLEYIADESEIFNRTVQRGLRDLEDSLRRNSERRLRGEEVLALEKRRGIPFSLLKYLCWQKGILYDPNEYFAAHERFRQKTLNLETRP